MRSTLSSMFLPCHYAATARHLPGLPVLIPNLHDDVIKWKHYPRYWPFVRGIHRSPVNFPHNDQWRGALMFYLICVWINGWVDNRKAGDLRRYRTHYDVIVMEGRWPPRHHYTCRQVHFFFFMVLLISPPFFLKKFADISLVCIPLHNEIILAA